MSIFSKGVFHVKDTWGEPKDNSKDRNTPKAEGNKDKNTILQNAAKNSFEPSHHMLDDAIAKRVLNQFNLEGGIQGLDEPFEKRTPSRGSDKGQRKSTSKEVLPVSSKNLLPPRQKNEKGDKNDDLMTSMATRLAKLEQSCKAQRLELKVVDGLFRRRTTRSRC